MVGMDISDTTSSILPLWTTLSIGKWVKSFFSFFFCEVKQFTKNNPVTLKFLCNISPNSILTLLN